MPKNIVIFSDGTGQRGGILFDECRSNIYKLYRATRCGPDSPINPAEQLTYYDPGIGTEPGGLGFFGRIGRRIHNIVGQATGLGITANIIDCYAAIIRIWEPGDRIFLFGFSRGAYTARCVAAVLALCGVPRVGRDGKALKLDPASVRAVARIGVKKVYQHVSSPKDTKYVEQRKALGKWFRDKFGSASDGGSNAYPHFIGVFDTVASVATLDALLLVFGGIAVVVFAVGTLLGFLFGGWLYWTVAVATLAVVTTALVLAVKNVRYAVDLDGYSFWQTLHFAALRLRFYDQELNPNVGYARHAIAIDENRASFPRVQWGNPKEWRNTGKGNPPWFKQLWFAGNHSDVGGSYPENESRLSDVSLEWMVQEAQAVPDGLKVDGFVLQLRPDPLGPQHDETRSSFFRFARKRPRAPVIGASLHPSVLTRFAAEKVLQYDSYAPYRPEALREHVDVKRYYETARSTDLAASDGSSAETGPRTASQP